MTRDGLTVTTKDGTQRVLKADTIIIALPLKPDTRLQKEMEGKANEVYAIGDAKKPALIFDAVAEGARIAHKI